MTVSAFALTRRAWDNKNSPRGAINTAEGLTTESLVRSEFHGCP